MPGVQPPGYWEQRSRQPVAPSPYTVPGGETSGAGPVGQDIMPLPGSASSVAPTGPPPTGPGPGPGPAAPTGGGPTKSAAPAGAGKDPLVAAGFSQAYANQLYDLQNQWEQISGYAQPITTDQLIAMAQQHVVGMGEFSRYVWSNVLGGKPVQQQMPWLQFGYDAETYHSRLSQLASDWQRYTGQVLNPTDGDLGQKWVEGQLGGVTPGLAAPSIIDDPAIQKAYGWVRYGLTFRDFQLKKEQMDDAFGTQLSNDQAVAQLHYFHTAQGAAQQARAIQRPPGQQAPTGIVATGQVR